MDTPASKPALPTPFDDSQGAAALAALLPRLQALDAAHLSPRVGVDPQLAVQHLLATAAFATAPEHRARFARLSAEDFDIAHVDGLETAAWALWKAAADLDSVRKQSSEALLPASLVQEGMIVEARMQLCCEYHLGDHSEAGKIVTGLSPGTSYDDLATDLLGYAGLYLKYHDIVRHDTKNYRPGDRADAVRIGERIIKLLGDADTPEVRAARGLLDRSWTHALTGYDETAAAGRFLWRKEPELAAARFGSLYTVARTSTSRKKDAEKPPAGTP